MQENKILKFLGFMWNPLSWVMEAAAIMAIALAHGGVSLRIKENVFFLFQLSVKNKKGTSPLHKAGIRL